MTSAPRIAVITRASQGIGEGLVAGYRKLGYAVVANSRRIADSDDPLVLAVPGDIAEPGIGRRIVDAAVERFGRMTRSSPWNTHHSSPARYCTSTADRAQATDMDSWQILAEVMNEWKAGIDAHDPGRVAAAFTDNAVFQGLRPYGVGRHTVAEYYDSQPPGMAVTYRVLESNRLADDVVLGYLAATFSYLDRPAVELFVGVVLTRRDNRWLVAHYQASQVTPG